MVQPKFMQIILGIIISFIAYFPITVALSFPFIDKTSTESSGTFPIFPIVATVLQIIIGALIIWKKPSHKHLGVGVTIGSVLMLLFVLFLTPSLGV